MNMENNQEIITINEVMNILNISSKQTIYNYIAEEKLTPINKDDWHIERRYEFDKEDVLRLKKELLPPGLKTSEAAALLDVSQTTINKLIRSGQLKAFQQEYKGKMYNFIKEDDLEEFQNSHEIGSRPSKKHFWDKEKNIVLFQPFVLSDDNNGRIKLARIVKVSEGEIEALTQDEEILSFEELQIRGFKPQYEIKDMKQSTKEGYATIYFKAPLLVNSDSFIVIDTLYQQIGPTNMRLTKIESEYNSYLIQIKPSLLQIDDERVYEFLKTSLKEGKIKKRSRGIYVDSDVEIIRIKVSNKQKMLLNKYIKESGYSTYEEVLLSVLE